ncbi:hypothetical protein [Burkholderia gladioli]|uniref:hypothetical protein n=1 Tax=Burkholderia gladioli TaxID=28095 RepID=UPI001641F7D5|nr:hypothetical protein [Burkholderia gladioli]
MNLQVLYGLWDELSRVQLGHDDCLGQAFLGFPAGTSLSSVHQWFPSQNPDFSLTHVKAGIRRPESSWSVLTLEESGDGTRVMAHGVRFDREHALSLALQVAKDLKAAIEAELMRDDPASFEPLAIRGTKSGYALMATANFAYATIEVRLTPVSTAVGEPFYEEPLSSFDREVALVA